MDFTILHNKCLGYGSFGSVFICEKKDNEKIKKYAIKIENLEKKKNTLKYESKILKYLKGGIGIPKIISYIELKKDNFLIMELLGENLETFFKNNNYHLDISLYINIGEQMLNRIEFLHSKYLIHNDIKPENFVFGKGKNYSLLYLIDFGLVSYYKNPINKNHISFNENQKIKGTLKFTSINSHMGFSLSRRDDLESLCYVLIYLWMGKLPWYKFNLGNYDKNQSIMNGKINIGIESELNDINIPKNLKIFLLYVKKLKFDEIPNYKYLMELISNIEKS